MPAYLHPLRRKIGLLTLVVACAFAAGWVRSMFVSDGLSIPIRKDWHIYFESRYQTVFWSQDESPAPYPTFGTNALPKDTWTNWHFGGTWDDVDWDWRRLGFAIGLRTIQYGPAPLKRVLAVAFPYWSIVAPLTLLAAWLLLSKPRPRQSTTKST